MISTTTTGRKLSIGLAFLWMAVTGSDLRAAKTQDTVFLATVNANYSAAFEEIARRYEQKHPEIKVKLAIIPMQFETWIRTRFAAGGDMLPDLYNCNFTSGFDELGKLVPLEPYLDSINPYTGARWRDGLEMTIVERYKSPAGLYAVPLDFIEIGIFYNQDIFDKLALKTPATWEELLRACERMKQAGYMPFALGGDANAYWYWEVGWLVRLLCDAYQRDQIPMLAAQPGDWDYDASRNAGFRYNGADLYGDLMVRVSKERFFKAIRDGSLDLRSARLKRVYSKLKEFSQYWQPGYMGYDHDSAIQLFYKQKAALCFLTSAHVTGIMNDMEKMEPGARFNWGVFYPPPITSDPQCQGPFRGAGGPGAIYSVTRKNNLAHERNVVDFFMYLTSPEAGNILVARTLAEKQPLTGPVAIKGVQLPEPLARRFAPFLNHGFVKIEFGGRGLDDEQESVFEWTVIAQDYMAGRLPLEEFLDRYQRITFNAAARLQKKFGYDLDPATRDAPPRRVSARNHLNPFENGTLMLILIVGTFGGFASYHIRRAKGPLRTTTRVAYLLLLPTFLLLATFNYFPAFSGLYHAFTEWEEGRDAAFNGLANFKTMLSDQVLYKGLGNLLVLLAAALFKATVVPFLAAEMILLVISPRLRYLFRTAFLLPMVTPAMVGILLWRFIYDPSAGLLNQFLDALHLGPLKANWLGEPNLALASLIFMGFPWIGAFGLLIYMAGLMNIPESVHEAYRLDSNNILRRILFIDAPLVKGQFRLMVILTFIGTLQDFQSILVLTGGGPGLASTVPALRMYHEAFRFSHFGYASAIGLVIFAAILVATLINLGFRKSEEER
ncbi:MAG: extracellular solute-binding protein [Verrucomicrobia bacterium]|nr:extracellular solute-binding protein [Verrucomicrobiota bacterium]